MMAQRCQSKEIKITKIKKINKIKNENKKNWKNKKHYSEKNPRKYHGPWVPNLILNYQALYMRNKDFFGSSLKTFPLEITILAIAELIERVEEIKKNIRTWGCGTSRFRVKALWRRITNFYFFCKTNNIFYSLENQIWDKTK